MNQIIVGSSLLKKYEANL